MLSCSLCTEEFISLSKEKTQYSIEFIDEFGYGNKILKIKEKYKDTVYCIRIDKELLEMPMNLEMYIQRQIDDFDISEEEKIKINSEVLNFIQKYTRYELDLLKTKIELKQNQIMANITNPINYAMIDMKSENNLKTFEEQLEEKIKKDYEEWLEKNCLKVTYRKEVNGQVLELYAFDEKKFNKRYGGNKLWN